MNTIDRRRAVARIIFLLILIISLLIGGLVWLDFLGIIDGKERLAPIIALFSTQSRGDTEQLDSPLLLDADRLSKERQSIAIERRDIERTHEELDLREARIRQMESEVLEKETFLEERQNSLIEAIRQYDNKVAQLEQSARYMMRMPPEDAVAIMNEYDLKNLVDLLRTSERIAQEAGEESLVAYWLSLMSDRQRAAEIQRLMVEKPGPDLNG